MSILGAPFFEEVLFRGVIFRGVRARLSERNENFAYPFALIFSAALFALAHFELLQLPGLFSVGLLLGYVVHRTGRLAPAIISHASFNTVAFVVVTFVQHGKV
jgi:membrane protease YdiL (CAAX protease family)